MNDFISRSALRKAIQDNGYSHYYEIFDIIDNAPPVEPPEWQFEFVKMLYEKARLKGKWIIEKNTRATICSNCGKSRRDSRKEHIYYCNHCGARMIKASEVIT